MALISRWELSNFLNSGKQARWRPDFVGEVFDFGGASAAVVMDNGTGKTSITDAVLFLLSQDRTLLDRTKSRFAKDSTAFFTHVRIEFVLPRDATQTSLLAAFGEPVDGGEYHVFGLYGNRTPNEGLDYKTYHYKGRLEACRVHDEEVVEGDVVKSLRNDTDVLDHLRDIGATFHKRNMDIQAELAEFVSPEQVRQLVDYQKQGGGDKSASFYAVTASKGETFDRAFFRQHIAPRLLSGNIEMLVDGEQKALPMEEGIVRQARAVVQAKLRTEQKAREVDDMAKVGRFLQAIRAKGDQWLEARAALQRAVEHDGVALSAVKALIERYDLPGAPISETAMRRYGGEWNTLHACATRPGGGLAIDKDKAALLVALTEPMLKGLPVYDDRHVIPLTADRIYRGRSAADDRRRYYDVEDILGALPVEGQDTQADLARHKLVEMDAFVMQHLAAPPRRDARAATAALNAMQAEAERVQADRDEVADRKADLLSQAERLSLLEAAYKELRSSDLFEDALDSADAVRAVGRAVETARTEADAALQKHRDRTTAFGERNRGWAAVRAEFGSGDLEALLVDLASAVTRARDKHGEAAEKESAARRRDEWTRDLVRRRAKAVETLASEVADLKAKGGAWRDIVAAFPDAGSARDLWGDLTARADEALAAKEAAGGVVDTARHAAGQAAATRQKAEADLKGLTVEREKLEAVAPAGRRFAADFPHHEPAAFKAQVEAAIRSADDRANQREAERDRLSPLVVDLMRFRDNVPGRTPHEWLADAAEERRRITLRLSEVETAARTLWAQLRQVRQDKAAPTDVDLRAQSLLGGLPNRRPLHDVLKEEVGDGVRLPAVLSALSAVLHAPVFADPAVARQAAERLAAAQLPVPVLVLADVRAALADARLAVTETDGLYRALFAGVQTDAVRAVVDPAFFRQQALRLALQLRDALAERRTLRGRMAGLAEGAPDVVLAQAARRAMDEGAEAALRAALAGLEEARTDSRRLQALLTPENLDLARRATVFAGLGGERRLGEVVEAVEAATAERERREAEERAADERLEQAEQRLFECEKALADAFGLRDRWHHRCEEAIAFQAAGGAAELDRLKQEEQRLWGRKKRLDEQARVREKLAREAVGARRSAEQVLSKAQQRHARWEAPLKEALAFEQDGGPDFLAKAPVVEEALLMARAKAAERCRFRFEDAARFLEAGGIEGAKQRMDELADLDRRLAHLEACKRKLADDLPKAEAKARHQRAEALRYENDLLAVVQIYPAVDRFTNAKGAGLKLPDAAALALETAGGRLLTAARALADRAIDVADMAAAMATLRELAEGLKAEVAANALRAAIDKDEAAGRAYSDEHHRSLKDWKDLGLGPVVLREEVGRCAADPAALAGHADRHAIDHQAQIRLLDDLRDKEEKSRQQLHGLLANHISIAGDNMNILRRVLAEGGGATFEIHGPEAAPMATLEAMLGRVVDHVRERERRWREEHRGREQEEGHLGSMFAKAKDEIYDVMFPNARIKVRHPMMRGGDAFFYDKTKVSGGQNTALNLLWSIKLASFAVARDAARLSGVRRRQARAASHSLLIVDGLFSDLSEPNLIAESLDAMRDIRGNFQLIGLIHSPYYRNDWQFFPTCIIGRAVRTIDETGAEGRMVSVQANRDGEGRVRALGLRAVRGLD